MSQTILLVNDERGFMSMVKTRLEHAGYNVVTSTSGREGVEKGQSIVPDLILLDVMMPEMDGAHVARLLHLNELTKDIPIIFFTAVLGGGEEDQGQGINVDGRFYSAIAKPFDAEKLLLKVCDLLGHNN